MTSALLAFLITISPTFLAGEQPPEHAPVPTVHASVVVETGALREAGAGPAIAWRLRSSAAALLRASSIAEDGGPHDPVVAVTVRPFGGRQLGYTWAVAVLREGRPLARSRQHCRLCTEGELVARVERSLAQMTPQLRQLASGDAAAGI